MIVDALNRGRGCVDDAGVGGDTEIGCRVERGIAEGCRASGRGGRRREEVRVERFAKSMIEVEVIDGRSIDHVGEGLFGWRVVCAVREEGGDVGVACANERGRDVIGGCSQSYVSASGCASRKTAEGTVARMSICIDSRARFDEASRGAPPGGSVESVRCRSSNR